MGKARNRTSKKSLRLAAAGVAAAVAVAPGPVVPPSGEMGVDGIGNYAGDLQTENNNKLLYTEAYGTPGSRSWGEWEKLERTNPFVAMGMDFIGGHIRDARVGVKASEKVAEGQRHADFVHWAVTEAMEPGVSEVNQQMVHGLTPGFALHELVWGNVRHETLPGGSGYAITRMAERLPSTMAHNAWHVMGGELDFVRQQGPDDTGRWTEAEIPANKLALLSWNRKGNNFAGYSVWRPVWYLAKIQEQLLKLGGIAMVREGAGIPTAVSASDKAAKLTDGQRRKLQRLLENLVFHENAAVVMPFGWNIEWVYSPAANKGHVWDAWQLLGQTILTIVQAQQLVLGVNGTGSRSVGETHSAGAMAFIQGVVVAIEGVWNGVGMRPYTGLVKKLVDANFGPQVEYPKLSLTLKKPQLDPKTRMEAMGAAKTAGALTITANDENVVREDLGLPPIDEKVRAELAGAGVDTALNGAQVTAATALMQAVVEEQLPIEAATEALVTFYNIDPKRAEKLMATLKTFKPKEQPAPPSPFGGPKPPGQPEPTDGPPKKLGLMGPFVPRRPLRETEKVLDLAAIDSFLDAAPIAFETRVRPIVTEMLVAAAPDIKAAMADGVPSEVATLTFDNARLQVAIAEYHEELRRHGNREVVKEIGSESPARSTQLRTRLGLVKLAGDEADPSDVAEAVSDATAVVDASEDALLRRMENRLRAELEREAIDVVRVGGNAAEVVSRTVVKQLDTGAFKADAGTVTTRIWNVGRDEAARIMGGVDTVERSAVLDNGTCDVCESMDGQTADFGTPAHDRLVPPERNCKGSDKCRCLCTYQKAAA